MLHLTIEMASDKLESRSKAVLYVVKPSLIKSMSSTRKKQVGVDMRMGSNTILVLAKRTIFAEI